jgi:hypothetical protein
MRKKVARVSVETSSAIEGIYAPFREPKAVKQVRAPVRKAKTKQVKG